MSPRAILIMAGGTGGHIFPALAVADCLHEQGVPLWWLGTLQGLESKIVPQAGYRLFTITITGIRGKGLSRQFLAPVRVVWALGQSLWVLLRYRPAAVLGMGGFVSGPGGIAAWLLRIPLLIHEQNAILGVTNRLLARFASRVMEAFPGTFSVVHKPVHTGNPVRREIMHIPPPHIRLAERLNQPLRLLVLGGSQGAEILNQLVPRAVAQVQTPAPLSIWHQSGRGREEATRRRYAELTIGARVEPFIENMAAAYSWADLVVCRAGALTLAELTAAGLASILVPYPSAVDDHQTANARYLAAAGAAILMPQSECGAERLAAVLTELQAAPSRLLRMSEHARNLACTEATQEVARICREMAHV
jgi:UDP-N-acetylglucosamine--N-acetylmuramyl-(pentapeptide) pyrophosphoryl-undecaprenol N-acetylglucosamine transferase